MTTDVERRLTDLLQQRAEAAMTHTDTNQELNRFLSTHPPEPPRRRRSVIAVAGATAAAAAVAAAIVFAGGLTDDRSEPAPAQQPDPEVAQANEAVEVAEQFVAAYAAHDVAATTALLGPGEPLGEMWDRHVQRDDAWNIEFLFEPCEAVTTNFVGTGLSCPFAAHVQNSEQVGRGPFEGASFDVFVDPDGRVTSADPYWNHENNGLADHLEAVWTWLEKEHPKQAKFLGQDEPDVPEADWDRWLRTWEAYLQKYTEANS